MIMLAALAVLTLTVPLGGGRLLHMRDPAFRHTWLLASALGLQLLITVVMPTLLPVGVGRGVHVLSYLLAFGWVATNRHVTGLGLAAVGGGMNLAAIVANGGQMPASEAALQRAGMAVHVDHFVNSGAVEGGARLQVLGDVFAVPAAWPLANVFSLGDIVLVLGGGLIVHHLAGSRWAWPRRTVRPRTTASDPGPTLADPGPPTARNRRGTDRQLHHATGDGPAA